MTMETAVLCVVGSGEKSGDGAGDVTEIVGPCKGTVVNPSETFAVST